MLGLILRSNIKQYSHQNMKLTARPELAVSKVTQTTLNTIGERRKPIRSIISVTQALIVGR